jgi:hypothetical protein
MMFNISSLVYCFFIFDIIFGGVLLALMWFIPRKQKHHSNEPPTLPVEPTRPVYCCPFLSGDLPCCFGGGDHCHFKEETKGGTKTRRSRAGCRFEGT